MFDPHEGYIRHLWLGNHAPTLDRKSKGWFAPLDSFLVFISDGLTHAVFSRLIHGHSFQALLSTIMINPFGISFLEDVPKPQECRKCRTGFIKRTKIITFDIVLGHKERSYCVRQSCIMERFPYFNASFLEIPSQTKEKLQLSHYNILEEELGYKQWIQNKLSTVNSRLADTPL